jgi:hypothetical protein
MTVEELIQKLKKYEHRGSITNVVIGGRAIEGIENDITRSRICLIVERFADEYDDYNDYTDYDSPNNKV